ncbi:hypothetical protein [Parapedobacter pyrenivorans]|uniref:hypothetical protein n=1 Tax=Parapedobacter pyrenivorans TaxID=1305674 RepID=UPI003341CE2B
MEVATMFRQYASIEIARISFQQYHRKLVSLYDRLYHAVDDASSVATEAVRQLLAEHEETYGSLVDQDAPMPVDYVANLRKLVQSLLPSIEEQLLSKDIPQVYLSELQSAMNTLFEPYKLPTITYHHRAYLPALLNALVHLANDTRTKSWLQRFMEAIVNHNFNHMGFYNRWQGQLDNELEDAWAAGRAETVLRQYQQRAQLYQPVPGAAFDPHRPSLKALMEIRIAHLWESLSDTCSNSRPLRTTALAGDIAVRFHYRHKAGEFDYDTQQQAAKDFTNAHLSKTGLPVSAHTLIKFDKSALYGPAVRYRRQLLKELALLEKDFKLNKTDSH